MFEAATRVFADNCPSEANLFHELGGGCLLAMLNKHVAYMTVIRLPATDVAFRSGTFEVLSNSRQLSKYSREPSAG
jgi:hypothetical protein